MPVRAAPCGRMPVTSPGTRRTGGARGATCRWAAALGGPPEGVTTGVIRRDALGRSRPSAMPQWRMKIAL
jgi:hypothetical protein